VKLNAAAARLTSSTIAASALAQQAAQYENVALESHGCGWMGPHHPFASGGDSPMNIHRCARIAALLAFYGLASIASGQSSRRRTAWFR
jgi:hypothetical protein